jgi:hypothetical protein
MEIGVDIAILICPWAIGELEWLLIDQSRVSRRPFMMSYSTD